MGYSAGGNLATSLTIKIKQEKNKVIPLPYVQVLISPFVDLSCKLDSHKEFENVDPLLHNVLEKFVTCYFRDSNFEDISKLPSQSEEEYKKLEESRKDINKFFSKENLSGLPPTTILVSEFDRLRSQSEAYYTKLNKYGVEVSKIIVKSETHSALWRHIPTFSKLVAGLFTKGLGLQLETKPIFSLKHDDSSGQIIITCVVTEGDSLDLEIGDSERKSLEPLITTTAPEKMQYILNNLKPYWFNIVLNALKTQETIKKSSTASQQTRNSFMDKKGKAQHEQILALIARLEESAKLASNTPQEITNRDKLTQYLKAIINSNSTELSKQIKQLNKDLTILTKVSSQEIEKFLSSLKKKLENLVDEKKNKNKFSIIECELLQAAMNKENKSWRPGIIDLVNKNDCKILNNMLTWYLTYEGNGSDTHIINLNRMIIAYVCDQNERKKTLLPTLLKYFEKKYPSLLTIDEFEEVESRSKEPPIEKKSVYRHETLKGKSKQSNKTKTISIDRFCDILLVLQINNDLKHDDYMFYIINSYLQNHNEEEDVHKIINFLRKHSFSESFSSNIEKAAKKYFPFLENEKITQRNNRNYAVQKVTSHENLFFAAAGSDKNLLPTIFFTLPNNLKKMELSSEFKQFLENEKYRKFK